MRDAAPPALPPPPSPRHRARPPTENEVVGAEEVPEGTRAHAVHRPRLQVHQDGARHVLVSCGETSCWRGPSAPPNPPPGVACIVLKPQGLTGLGARAAPPDKRLPTGSAAYVHTSLPEPPPGSHGAGRTPATPPKKKITQGVQHSWVHAPIPPKPQTTGVSWSSFSPFPPPNRRVPRGWGYLSVPTPPRRDAGGSHKGGVSVPRSPGAYRRPHCSRR